MKRLLTFISILTFATAARAEFTSVALTSGDNPLLSLPARAVAIQVVSTNATGTVELVKVATHEMRWEEPEVATTTNYVDVTTNLYHVVTNDIVTVWLTRTVGNGVVETNVYAQAANETPAYPDWPNLFVTTNKVEATESYTNWTYQVVGGITVATNTVERILRREWTNTLLSTTLSGGIATNRLDALIFPGESIRASGTAFVGGKATRILER